MERNINMVNEIRSVTIGLAVTDLEKAIVWYRQLLGNPEELEPVPGVHEFRITSSAWLQLFQQERIEGKSAVLRFESSNIQESHQLALKLGSEVGDIILVPEAVRYFEFCDPFGNMLSFYEMLVA